MSTHDLYSIHFPDAPCVDDLPTSGETWPHSRKKHVGKYSLHGASGFAFQVLQLFHLINYSNDCL